MATSALYCNLGSLSQVSRQRSLPSGPRAPATMPAAAAGLLLWASLLTGAWPATPLQDHLLATPRVRLSFKGKRLFSCSPASFSVHSIWAESRTDNSISRSGSPGYWAGMEEHGRLEVRSLRPSQRPSVPFRVQAGVLAWASRVLSAVCSLWEMDGCEGPSSSRSAAPGWAWRADTGPQEMALLALQLNLGEGVVDSCEGYWREWIALSGECSPTPQPRKALLCERPELTSELAFAALEVTGGFQ